MLRVRVRETGTLVDRRGCRRGSGLAPPRDGPWKRTLVEELLKSDLFTWGILPLLIFLGRVLDVSMGTVRVILISRGIRALAAVIGFFEVCVWLLAIGQIMRRLDNAACFLAYGLGFATGTYAGMVIEGWLRIGKVIVRVITARETHGMIERMRALGCGVTCVDAQGATGPVKLIFSVIRRRDLAAVVRIVKDLDPRAFYTVGDVRLADEGTFPHPPGRALGLPRLVRKGK